MDDGERVRALNEIADKTFERYSYAKRFAQWGDSASNMFLRTMDQLGYELVRKDDGRQ